MKLFTQAELADMSKMELQAVWLKADKIAKDKSADPEDKLRAKLNIINVENEMINR